ncbi:hypothetical protein [uncultured Vagococcus sp.]|uniref:hypothetical protein n=1 Tax=uncultured Vagococcus sp. TaxID=189676 RepID=UPI0028D4D55A|nr:hypothetical protein [uncultured Vagococcus sp.]
MTFVGINVAEWAAFLGIMSILCAAAIKFYRMFRTHITAPLIEAVDKLRIEISQLEHYLVTEYQELKKDVEVLRSRVNSIERHYWELEREVTDDDYRVINKG